ncbi:MAG: site-specific DNA-methyltransferase [Gammaproteobacteria bacterium]
MLNQINLPPDEKPAREPSPARTSKPARAAARKSQPNYIEKIFKISAPYLRRVVAAGHLTESDLLALQKQSRKLAGKDASDTVVRFNALYYALVKKRFQSQYKNASAGLHRFIDADKRRVKIVWGNCLDVMRSMKTESVHLMVTSPPYYNARAYSQWPTLDHYLADMEQIIAESYRVIDNHRAFVFNVGDITGNDNRSTKSSWGARRIPLGAYFINIFEKAGFKFIDDFVWDKGQVESQRHKNGDTPHPLYQYPMNCYEHIMVFYKHRADETRYPCPVCGCLKVNGNAYSGVGIRSWECKNEKCFERSAANRGKRFSARSVLMDALKTNVIDQAFVKKWRRDIVQINPTIKINSKGENTLGHTAPFPKAIPEFAIEMLTGKGEVVVDPFAGSFTSAIQAVEMGRVGVGIEINKAEFKKAIVNNIAKHGLPRAEFSHAKQR